MYLFTISVLTAVAGINNAVDVGDAVALMDALKNEEAALESVDDALGSRYLSHFIAVKSEKREVCRGVFSFLFLRPSNNNFFFKLHIISIICLLYNHTPLS